MLYQFGASTGFSKAQKRFEKTFAVTDSGIETRRERETRLREGEGRPLSAKSDVTLIRTHARVKLL